jgi:hypothetical protein
MAEKSLVKDEAVRADPVPFPLVDVALVVFFFEEPQAASPAAVIRTTDTRQARLNETFIIPSLFGVQLNGHSTWNANFERLSQMAPLGR